MVFNYVLTQFLRDVREIKLSNEDTRMRNFKFMRRYKE